MLITVCSAKGSPGVSSLSLCLAAAWPDEAVLVLEADPSGGDLQFRCRHRAGRVAVTPNLLSLAAAVRGSGSDAMPSSRAIAEHAQPLACGVRVVIGLTGSTQAGGLGQLWTTVAQVAASSDLVVVADVGRIDAASASAAFLHQASRVIVVCRPTVESVVHTRSLLAELRRHRTSTQELVVPAVVTNLRRADAEAADIAGLLGVDTVSARPVVPIAWDPTALGGLERGANPRGRLAGTRLLRSVAALVEACNVPGADVGATQSPAQAPVRVPR